MEPDQIELVDVLVVLRRGYRGSLRLSGYDVRQRSCELPSQIDDDFAWSAVGERVHESLR